MSTQLLRYRLIVVSVYDGIGGLVRAFELLKIKPDILVSIEIDKNCAAIVKREWPTVTSYGDVKTFDRKAMDELRKRIAGTRGRWYGMIGGGLSLIHISEPTRR